MSTTTKFSFCLLVLCNWTTGNWKSWCSSLGSSVFSVYHRHPPKKRKKKSFLRFKIFRGNEDSLQYCNSQQLWEWQCRLSQWKLISLFSCDWLKCMAHILSEIWRQYTWNNMVLLVIGNTFLIGYMFFWGGFMFFCFCCLWLATFIFCWDSLWKRLGQKTKI